MNQKGFTMVELIAAVSILVIVSIIVTISLSKMNEKNSQKRYNDFKETVEKAGCTYIELSVNRNIKEACYPNCTIDAYTLINEGLISADLVNPNTDEPIQSISYVRITWDTNTKVKTCELIGD